MMWDFILGCIIGAMLMFVALKYAEIRANREREVHETEEKVLAERNRHYEAEHNYRLGWDAHVADTEEYLQSLLMENNAIREENTELRKEMNNSLMFADTFSKGGSVRVTAIRRRTDGEATRGEI